MWHPKTLPENIFVNEKNKLICKLCNKALSRQSWFEHNSWRHRELIPKKNLGKFMTI
jgi:hypothetical protein